MTTSPSSAPNWLEFWYEAAASEYGIVVATSDVEAAKQKLYQARAKAADPELQGLQLRTSPILPDEEIWILKGPPADGSKSQPPA